MKSGWVIAETVYDDNLSKLWFAHFLLLSDFLIREVWVIHGSFFIEWYLTYRPSVTNAYKIPNTEKMNSVLARLRAFTFWIRLCLRANCCTYGAEPLALIEDL